MLQGFRTVINSLVGKIFFLILLATFALLGVGYGFRDLVLDATSSNDAAKVGSTKITIPDLDRTFRQQLSNYQRQLGPSFTPTTQQKQELARATLNQQVVEALYNETATQDGLRVSDALVRQIIESEPAFAGEDKKFDRVRFRMMLENQGLNEATFIPAIRRNVARQLLINPIAGSAIAPKSLVEDIYRYRNEQRVAQSIFIPDTAAANVPAPSESDIDSYYKKHSVEFTAPEYRSFTVLALTPDLFIGDIKPTDEELHAAYDAHKSEYVVAEKRKIDQVLVADKATADAIAKTALSGKSLAEATKTATGGKAQVISLDPSVRDEFPEALRDPVFSGAKDTVIGPVQTPLGWHVVEVKEIQPGHEVPFDDVKAKIAEDVKRDAAADRLSGQIDKLGDKILGGAPMEEVAAVVNAKTVKFTQVDAKGGLADPAAPKPDPAWTSAAFQLQPGETSPFQDGKDGGYFAVRLDSVTPPALRPLADVKAEIVKDWTAEQRDVQIAKRAEDLAAKAKAGTAMTQIAGEAGVKMETTVAVTRDPSASKIANAPPHPAVDALFGLSKIGEIATVKANDGQYILRLTEIRQADPLAAGVDLSPMAQELSGAIRSDEIAQYAAGLRKAIKVTLNPQAVDTVAGQ
jgi:peptidyl-prolyl cis-trans isomerase D